MTRLVQWCTRRRFAVLVGWSVALLLLAGLALRAGSAFTDSTQLPNSESGTAYSLLASTGNNQLVSSGTTVTGTIAWHTRGVAVTDAAVREDVTAALGRIAALPGVETIVSPYDPAGARQVNTSANTAYATLVLSKSADTKAVERLAQRLRGATIDVQFGDRAFTAQPGASHLAEAVGLAAALLILLLVFRSVWAAALPVLTGVTAVGASLLAVTLASHVVHLADTSLTMGALIGLGVGIDYALFIVNRHRGALLAGSSVPESISQAMDTSGRAVVFAGLTVIAALLGMFVVNLDILTGMAQAAALTVLFTMASAITLLPALLAVLGPRVLSRRQRRTLADDTRPRPGAAVGANPAHSRQAAAARWAGLVQRAPRRAVAVVLVGISVLAAPALSMRVGSADASSDPAGSSTRAYYDLMSAGFGKGFDATLLLVARTPDQASAKAFTALVAHLPSVTDVAAATTVPVPARQHVAIAAVVPSTSAQAVETTDLVNALRHGAIPAAEAGTALRVYVGGTTATSIDLSQTLMGRLPLYLALIATLGFLLLATAFRSVLIPLVGAASNIASILVGLGAITAIFQSDRACRLFGVGTGGPVSYIIPVVIVGVVFGLSMDYQVFLVSRMREEWTRTGDNTRSVRTGVAQTARVIATAATVMVCVFGSFGFSGQRIVSAIGVGMAAAVLIDAFAVRLTLVPALMHLTGRRNWWFPHWAQRLAPERNAAASAAPPVTAAAPRQPLGGSTTTAPAEE